MMAVLAIVIVVLPVILYFNDAYPQVEVRSLLSSSATHNTEDTMTAKPQEVSTDPQPSSFLRQNKGEGFHSIHVYHGPIDSLPTESRGLLNRPYAKGSQVDQDKIVAALAQAYAPNQQHYFVDLAANDALQLSNTFLLEQKGWKGLCVEPNPMYWFRLAHRQCDVAAAFVSNKDMEPVTVSLTNKEFGGIVGSGMDNNNKDKNIETEQRYTISLQTLFEDFNVPKSIDYLSLDVEGAEELIMKDFPFDFYKIHFLTVERPKPELQTILKSHGYVYVIMLKFWGETLWVHESVEKKMGMENIQQIVRSNSNHVDKIPRQGQFKFYIETGEYKRVRE